MLLEVTITALSDIQQEADILLGSEDLKPHFEKAYQEYRPKAQIRGFRKGKVPLDMIKRLYGEAIEQDALDAIADACYRKAMEERKIHPLGQPKLMEMDFKRGTSFRFRITYEVRPPITLKKYKAIGVEKPVRLITDDEIDNEMIHLQRANSTLTPADTVTDTEFVVTADVQEVDGAGTPLIGTKKTDVKFRLYETNLAPEIRDALRQAVVGGTYRADIASQHQDHTHTTHLTIKPTAIERVGLPPVDEAFVKKITGGTAVSVEEFRSNLRKDLASYWEEQANVRVRDAIAEEIVREHEFPVPESLVEAFLDSFLDDIKNRARGRTLPPTFDHAKFRTENRAYAVWQAKWMLLKERIAEQENITVTDEEMDALAAQESAQIGVAKERLLQYYKSTGSLRDRLLSDKLMAFLKDHASIKETVRAPEKAPHR